MNSLVVIRSVSTTLLVLSVIQFAIVGLKLRPSRTHAARVDEGDGKPVPVKKITPEGRWLVWREYAGHTPEQRILQTAIAESVIGTIMLIVTKFL